MSGAAGLAAFALLALVGANAWKGGALSGLTTGQINASAWKAVGIELGGVVVATFIAGSGDSAAKLVLVLAAGLWILFAIHTWGNAKTPVTTPSAPTGAAKGTVVA